MDQFYNQVVQFQRRVNDWLDDRSSSTARSLQTEVQRLEDDVQTRKNSRTVEARVMSVMRLLNQAGNSGAMSHPHADELMQQCENFRQQLRKMQ